MSKKKNPKPGQLPSGKYRYRLYLGEDAQGKKQYKSFTADSMRKAQQAAQDWKSSHRVMNPDNPTFSEAAALFLANRSATLSPSTYAVYARTIKRFELLYPAFCKKRISAIMPEDVQAVINEMSQRTVENYQLTKLGRQSDRRVSPKTVSNYYGLIRSVLGSQRVDVTDVLLPQKKKPQLNIPENETVTTLLDLIKGTELEVPVLLAAFGPMRRGEICALRMEDIDFASHTVHVHRCLIRDEDKQWVEKPPKTTAGDRFIVYPEYVTNLIRERGYVAKMTPDTLSTRFTRTLTRHGFESFRFHDLRHFSASFQIALGIAPEYVQERGGWSTGATMARYIHALDEQRKQMSAKTNDAFSKLL